MYLYFFIITLLPSCRVLLEFHKGDLNPHEIQMLASAIPMREVLDTAFEYCLKEKRIFFYIYLKKTKKKKQKKQKKRITFRVCARR
jgi:hypothetical protein